MSEVFDAVIQFARSRWPSRTAAAALSILLAAVLLLFLAQVDLFSLAWWQWAFVLVGLLLPWLCFAWSVYIPRSKKRRDYQSHSVHAE